MSEQLDTSGDCPFCGQTVYFDSSDEMLWYIKHLEDHASNDVVYWQKATKKPVDVRYLGPFTDPAVIKTMEGDFEVDDEYINEHGGYVIIEGVDGERYPCALDVFEETYDYNGSIKINE